MSPPPTYAGDASDDKAVPRGRELSGRLTSYASDPHKTASTSGGLNVPLTTFPRSASPDTWSNLSVEEFNSLHGSARVATYAPPPDPLQTDDATQSTGARGLLQRFWLRNKGLALVLLAQVFGTLMNVTTRLLEIEGNNGKGMHPFQVRMIRDFYYLIYAKCGYAIEGLKLCLMCFCSSILLVYMSICGPCSLDNLRPSLGFGLDDIGAPKPLLQ